MIRREDMAERHASTDVRPENASTPVRPENETHVRSEEEEVPKSGHAPVPRWLIVNYIFWPIFGLVWFYLFWNGSYGWLDRGYWKELQEAANTTIPFENASLPPK